MEQAMREFVNSFSKDFHSETSISETVNHRGNINFQKVLKENNHEKWKVCKCGNEEDLRVTWKCSQCGTVLFEPSIK